MYFTLTSLNGDVLGTVKANNDLEMFDKEVRDEVIKSWSGYRESSCEVLTHDTIEDYIRFHNETNDSQISLLQIEII